MTRQPIILGPRDRQPVIFANGEALTLEGGGCVVRQALYSDFEDASAPPAEEIDAAVAALSGKTLGLSKTEAKALVHAVIQQDRPPMTTQAILMEALRRRAMARR